MPDPVLPGRLGLYASMLHYGFKYASEFAREHAEFYRDFVKYSGNVSGRRILDFGCGKTFWLTLLLASQHASAIGVDTEITDPARSAKKYWRIYRQNGVERAMRTLVWDVIFADKYYRELQRQFGSPLRFHDVKLIATNGAQLPIPDNSIDIVVSHEVLEHVDDLETAFSEMRRVVRNDGFIYLHIHHFMSLSGGHHIAWKHPDTRPSKKVPPWDHLRQRSHTWIPSKLNQRRVDEYLQLLSKHFDLIEWRWLPKEGVALLTPSIRAELSAYSEEELLHKGFLVIAKPQKGN